MIIPNIWKNHPNVPNHQPEMVTYIVATPSNHRLQKLLLKKDDSGSPNM